MTKENIIRMAQEAYREQPVPVFLAMTDAALEQFFQAAYAAGAAAEREACAEACDELAYAYQKKNPTSSSEPLMRSCWNNAAAAIRARGQA